MASSGRRMATDVSGTQHEENKGFADNSALKEEHDPNLGLRESFNSNFLLRGRSCKNRDNH